MVILKINIEHQLVEKSKSAANIAGIQTDKKGKAPSSKPIAIDEV